MKDPTPPSLSGMPATITAEATSAAGTPSGVVLWAVPTATDLVDSAVPVTCVPASAFALGETLVSCAATDAHANRAEAVFAVHIVDTTGPALLLPASAGAEATSSVGAIVTYTASATDLVTGAAPIVCAPASGGTFAIGLTVVSCSAADGTGHRSLGEFPVVVIDTIAPVVQITSPSVDASLSGSNASVTAQVTDIVGVTSVTVNGVPASRTSGHAQAGVWSATVPILPVAPGGAVRFEVTALDGSNSRTVSRLVDNDGIPSAVPPPALAPFGLDRSRATGSDLSNTFTDDFNNGITAGTVTRNGWTMTLAPGSAAPRPLLLVPGAVWPSIGWVQASIAGAGTTAVVSACSGGVKQVRLDVVGERAAIACDPVTGTIAVKAMSAAPTIEVWKQLSSTLWLSVALPTGAGMSTGSPTTANPDNPDPIDGQVVSYDDRGVVSVIGTFQLAPARASTCR